MGKTKSFWKITPVAVLTLAILTFANSTVTVAREAGYVPVVVTSTGTTGGAGNPIVGSGGGTYGHGHGHRHHHYRKRKSKRRAETERSVSLYALHSINSVRVAVPPHDPNADDGPQYYLDTGRKYIFSVRWRASDDQGNQLSMPTVTWAAALFNAQGHQVSANLNSVIDISDTPDVHDRTSEENGTITLRDDGIFSEREGYYIRLVAYVQHHEPSSDPNHHADEKSSPHNSVRLYWAQSTSQAG